METPFSQVPDVYRLARLAATELAAKDRTCGHNRQNGKKIEREPEVRALLGNKVAIRKGLAAAPSLQFLSSLCCARLH